MKQIETNKQRKKNLKNKLTNKFHLKSEKSTINIYQNSLLP